MTGLSTLPTRVAVASLGILLMGLALYPDIPLLNTGLFALIAGIAVVEGLLLITDRQTVPEIAAVFAISFSATFAVAFETDYAVMAIIAPGLAFSAARLLRADPRGSRRELAGFIGLSALVIAGMGFLARHRLSEDGLALVLIPLLICWMGDTAAYLLGCMFGRHKLMPSVSPAKSWEGFAGGIAGSMAGAAIAGSLLAGLPLFHMLPLGAAGGLLAVLGDLLESSLKRDAGVKDTGAILPGHGGLLDRFDSAVLVAPATWLWLVLSGLVSV